MASKDPESSLPETDPKESRRKLDAFLVDNQELEALNARLAQFNLFRVLRIEHAEIRHSHMLAWLLTPGESHGLGSLFLRRFLSRFLMENEDVKVSLTPAKVELMPLDDVEVFREWHNVDILVHSATGNWSLIIENKVKARESLKQLERYRKKVESEFPGTEIIPVFLTLGGDDPSVEGQAQGYVSLGHTQILEIADRISVQHRSRIPAAAAILIDHYLATLRRLTMSDPELVDLCKTIYRKHREAIDLIVEYGATSKVLDACEEKVIEFVGKKLVTRTGDRVWFLPREMALFPTEMAPGWGFLPKPYPIMWWFYYYKDKGKLQLSMEIGPISDQDYRLRLVKKVKGAGFIFSKYAFREKARFTRIVSLVHTLEKGDQGEPNDDPEHIAKVAGDLWAKGWGEGKKIVEVLNKCKPRAS